jgi:hypothetical protein
VTPRIIYGGILGELSPQQAKLIVNLIASACEFLSKLLYRHAASLSVSRHLVLTWHRLGESPEKVVLINSSSSWA